MTRGTRLRWLGFLAPAVVALLAYLSATRGTFVLDDETYVVRNPSVIGGAGVFDAATPPDRPDLGLYRPLTVLSYRWQHEISGLDPGAFRRANVGLHAATSSLMVPAALAIGATPAVAVVAACIFALHPVHVEAVAWIVGRAEILATLFALLALITRPRRAEFDALRTPVAAICLALAALSKESAFPFAAVLVLADVLARRPRRVILSRAACYALALACVIGARIAVLGRFGPEVGTHPILGGISPLERSELALRILGFAVRSLTVPDALSIWYEPRIFGGVTLLVLGSAVLVGTFAILARALYSGRTLVAAGFAWFLVSMLPFLHLIPIGWVFGDRFLYLASAGFTLGLVAAVAELPVPRSARTALTVLVISMLGWLTLARVPVFHDDRSLWEDAIAKDPASGFSHFQLAGILEDRARFDYRSDDDRGAIHHWQESLRVDPRHLFAARTHSKLGEYFAYVARDSERALPEFRAAAELDPSFRDPLVLEAMIRFATLPAVPIGEALGALETAKRASKTPEQAALLTAAVAVLLDRADPTPSERARLTALIPSN